MSTEQTTPADIDYDYDPAKAEIIRERLYNIADEMATVMIRTSGNIILVEAVDFSTIILGPEGGLDTYSAYVTIHHGPAREAVKHILEVYDEEEINEGDQFICNDPFTTGNQHPPDAGVIKPIFYDDELVAWSWAETNLLDIGGVGPGGIAPQSTEAYADAIRFPGVKIVDEGELIHDIKRMFYTNVRIPDRVFNDIRALMAANNRCEERLHDTVDEFGVDTFQKYRAVNNQLSERALEKRISDLPDGTYSTTEYVEHDGKENKLYKLPIDVTIDGTSLTIDFTGAAEQAPGYINLTRGGSIGHAMTPIMFLLAPDIPANEGMFEAIDIITPEGTIVNANLPVGLSTGVVETGFQMSRGLTEVLNRITIQSDNEFVREHSMAAFQDVWPVAVFYGINQYGEPDVHVDTNGGGAGGGALPMKDGLNCAGVLGQLNNQLPDIERNEDEYPQLYLWRQLNTNSGGPGEYRGGLGHEYAWTLHKSPGGEQTAATPALEVPVTGVAGGYPGNTTPFRIIQESDISDQLSDEMIPTDLDDIEGERRTMDAKEIHVPIGEDTVFSNSFGGGSGFGDPLERSQRAVLEDVRDGLVTAEAAEAAYGVVIEDGELDKSATETRREKIREERTQWGTERELTDAPPASKLDHVRLFTPYLNVVESDGSRLLQCSNCDSAISPFTGADDRDWLKYTAINDSQAADRFEEFSMYVKKREEAEDIRLREHACPECGVLLETEVQVRE